MTSPVSGVLNALSTPFNKEGNVDESRMRWLVDRSVNAGIDAVVVGGGTGEFAWLTHDERRQIIDVVLQHAAGRIPVVAQTGALTAREATTLSRAAEAGGADVLMLTLPYYEPLSGREVARYLHEVAESVSIPVMLYNNPFTTGVHMDVPTLVGFARDIPNVEYVKDSSKDWEQALRLIHYHSHELKLIMGWDSFSFGALLEGATGVMAGSANLVPDELVAVVRAIRGNDIVAARAAWQRVFPVLDTLVDLPFSQAVKAGLRLRGESIGAPRAPQEELDPESEARLAAVLERLDNRL